MPQPAFAARLTHSHALWLGILAMAFAIRAVLPGAAMLNNAEAAQALAALSAANGSAASFANPFFGWLQSLGFAVFGAGEASARMWSMMAGAALCLLPAFLPGSRARSRVLLMGLLLAMSPTLWFISRQATGIALAWVFALAAWVMWQRNAPRAAFIFCGLLLACGADAPVPALITALAIFANAIAITKTETGYRINLDPATLPPARAWLFALAAFILASTGFFTRLTGAAEAINGWAIGLRPAQNALTLGRSALGFLIYEPLVWVFALAAPMALIANKARLDQPAPEFSWVVLGLMALVAGPALGVTCVVPLVIGCAMLAAFALSRVVDGLWAGGSFAREGMAACVLLLMLFIMDIGLRNYAGMGQMLWLISGLLALAMTILAGIAFSLLFDTGTALRGLAVAVFVFLGLYTAASAIRLNYLRPANPAEPYVTEGAVDGLGMLSDEINALSIRAYSDPGAIPMQVMDSAPASLRWALRNERKLTYTTKPQSAEALVMPLNTKPDGTASFSGDAFEVSQTGNLDSARCIQAGDQLNCQPLAKWLVFRDLPSVNPTRWVLWVRQDLLEKAGGKK